VTLLLPVGHDLGAFHAGNTQPVQQIRIGAQLAELTAEEFRVWSLAHGLTDSELDLGLVASLVDRGLLAEVEPDDPVRFAETHRLIPLALGLGNTPDQPWMFSVGLLYQPVVSMTGALFDLWQWAHLSPNLWWACRESAAIAERAEIADPTQTDPLRVLVGLLGALHQLLTARVACLDLRIEGLR
jgi:hypothetical protein